MFGIDPRSLALFRVAIGLLLLVDLATRASDLKVMYTDDGMFSRAEVCRRATSIWNWSFHFASGSAGYQAMLFVIAGALALALLIGFETRIAAISSWLMMISIHHRVHGVLSGAEILLRMLLFWAMFLPLQRAWSVDQRCQKRGEPQPPGSEGSVISIATAAILLQMAMMYFFSAVSKSNSQWLQGDALRGILAHDFYASPPAAFLLRFPGLLTVLTWATLVLEWMAPVLLFFPKWSARLRLWTIAALAAMHLGIGICLEVGLFSYVSLAGLALFLPPEFWNSRLLARLSTGISPQAHVANPEKRMAQNRPRFIYATQGFCAFAFAYVVTLNINALSSHPLATLEPEKWKALSTGLGLSQSWGMFGEVPSMNGWYIARATLKDGSEVDLLRGGAAVDWRRPEYPARLYPNHFWQKIFREMTYFDEQGFQVYRAPVAEYLCRQWNARNPGDKQVLEFEFIFCMKENEAASEIASSPRVVRRQLVRLDFSPESDHAEVSGYSDATQL